MALVVSVAAEQGVEGYASIGDVREVYVTEKPDSAISKALRLSKALVDGRAGRAFSLITEQIAYDVRNDTVVLNEQGEITSVSINGTEASPTAYEVTPWGLRFIGFTNGWWYHPSQPLLYEPISAWWDRSYGINERGATIRVQGSFGGVPDLIQEATILLAVDALSDEAGAGGVMGGIMQLPEDIQSASVEGLSVSRFASAQTASTAPTTGNRIADRYIDMVVRGQRGVGIA